MHTNESNDAEPTPGQVVEVQITDDHPNLRYKVLAVCREQSGTFVRGTISYINKDHSVKTTRPFRMTIEAWNRAMHTDKSTSTSLPGAAAVDPQEGE